MNSDLLKDVSILLVEDNQLNRLVASTIVQNYGARVTEAENGQEALDILKTNAFHLVLMDLHMPVMSGQEATRYIRENISSSDLPIIALTANALKGENDDPCIASGMNDYLSKPYREEDLIRKISNCLKENPTRKNDTVNGSLKINYTTSHCWKALARETGIYNPHVASFCEQVPVSVAEIKQAYETNDFPKIKSVRPSHQAQH